MLNESLRPQFHFTAPKGWLNDPNGLVFENGNYHLFYQHNPFGTQWGNMTWGHAVSSDLIHWANRPNALEPDALGTIFSGSAVIDHRNTSGLGTRNVPPIVCLYTAAGGTNEASKGQPFTQCLAWSIDGKTFKKYDKNPVIGHIAGENRDPKVIWHEPSKKWIMALYLDADRYCLLGSKNLIKWDKLSELRLPGTSECPDFFALPLDGNDRKMRWVFWGANGNYLVGGFDGTTFRPSSELLHSHFGNTGYAAQTYSDVPRGRRIQVSWFRDSTFPNCEWNQQMGFPNTLRLRTTRSGPRLCFWPVEEIQKIRKPEAKSSDGTYPIASGLIDFEGDWLLKEGQDAEVTVNGINVTYDGGSSTLSVQGHRAPVSLRSGHLQLRILADRTSLEVYAQGGETLINVFALPKEGAEKGVRLDASNGPVRVRVYELRP